MLAIARSKKYDCEVELRIEDAYALPFKDNEFDGGMANFWFSHIPKNRLGSFFDEFHRILKNGAVVFLADNNYVEGLGGSLATERDDINTYKIRKLTDGSQHKILKNYYQKPELLEIFSKFDNDLKDTDVFYGQYYWAVPYKLDKRLPS